jgi:hypothetical protein
MFRLTVSVAVLLAAISSTSCSDDAEGASDVSVTGVNICPDILSVNVGPLSVDVGAKIGLRAEIADPDDEWLYLWWSAKSGFIAGPSDLETTYECTEPGEYTITFSVTDNDECTDRVSVPVTCTDATE